MSDEEPTVGMRLRGIIVTLVERKVTPERIRDKDRIIEDLGFDSMLAVELMLAVEAEFALRFDPEGDDMPAIFATVGALALYIEEKAGGTNGR